MNSLRTRPRRVAGRIVSVVLLQSGLLLSGMILSALAPAVPLPSTSLVAQATVASDLQVRIQARLDSLVGPAAIPGMTLGLTLPDGTTHAWSAGMADTTRGQTMPVDGVMLQGSVGKVYFGAVALQLVAEGRIGLDAPISDYLGDEPWFDRIPNGADATVRQIMSQTSGIVRYEFTPGFLADLTADPLRSFTPEQRLSYLFDTEAPFEAGTAFEYSDTNFILVAMIIEKVTGNRAYDEIRDRVLDAHGFERTFPSDSREVPFLVQGYAGVENPFGGFDEMVVDGRLAINPQFEWGGGGFASTADELARWTWLIHEGRAFDEALLPDFRTGREAPLGPQARYGLGVIMMELPSAGSAWGHSGFMPGYRTEAYYFPNGRFALALQINTTAQGAITGSPLRMLDGLAAIVLEEIRSEEHGPEAGPDESFSR